MADPIVIGPYDNVPAPGSPIRSDWAQELTTYAVKAITPVGATLIGGAAPIGTLKLIAGTIAGAVDATYLVRQTITPDVFPNGLLSVIGMNGDQVAGAMVPMTLPPGNPSAPTLTELRFVCLTIISGAWQPVPISTVVRINYLAVGW